MINDMTMLTSSTKMYRYRKSMVVIISNIVVFLIVLYKLTNNLISDRFN